MQLSLTTGSLYWYPLRWFFALAKEVGLAGIELDLGLEATRRGSGYVRRLSREYELPILSLHPPLNYLLGGKDNFSLLPWMIDYAQQINCALVILHPPKATSFERGAGRKYLETLEACRRKIAGSSIQISLENRPFFSGKEHRYLLSDSEELRRFADEHDLPLTLDTSHAAVSGRGVLETYELFKGRLVNVHLGDVRPLPRLLDSPYLHSYLKHHQIPGHGHLPLAEFLGRLASNGYCGPITLEISPVALGAWWPGKVKANLARCVDFVQEAVSK